MAAGKASRSGALRAGWLFLRLLSAYAPLMKSEGALCLVRVHICVVMETEQYTACTLHLPLRVSTSNGLNMDALRGYGG